MIFLRKYIAPLAAILLLAYYLILAWLLHRVGYQHSESFFLAEKAKLLFQCKDNSLMTLGTTFPTLVYLSTVAFSFFGYPLAPIMASVTFTTILFFVLIQDFEKSKIPRRVFLPALSLLFTLHPGLVFTAITGRGIAIVLLFFYLLFRSLFGYYKTKTTFDLSMASIYLTCLIFCNYQFIWLLVALLPFMVLVSLDGVKMAQYGSPIVQFYEAVNNRSQRRKLVNRSVAIYLILFLLPLVAVILFKFLNQIHAGNTTYFLTSQYSNWKITGTESVGDLFHNHLEGLNLKAQSHIVFQTYLFLLTPILILAFFLFKGKLYEILTLIVPFIFISIILLDNQVYLTVEYYLIFVILGLLGVMYFAGRKSSADNMYGAFLLATIATIFTGFFYFKKSSDREEKGFVAALKNTTKPLPTKVITEEKRVATYISTIVDDKINVGNKILIDDAAAYPIVAQMKKLNNIILPANVDFVTLAENPKAGANYMCIATKNNKLKSFTILNDYNMQMFSNSFAVPPTLMFETENWAIYKLNSHFEN